MKPKADLRGKTWGGGASPKKLFGGPLGFLKNGGDILTEKQ